MDISNVFAQALLNSVQFNMELFNAFTEAYPIYLNTIYEYNRSWKDLSELDKIWSNQNTKWDVNISRVYCTRSC